MVIDSLPKFQLTHSLLLIIVCFSIWTSLAGRPHGVLALTSSTVYATSQVATWKQGDHVEVQWKGDWYQAEVLEVKGNQFKVHYDGYASSWDEWVENSRIRAAGAKPNNPTITSQSPITTSPFDQVVQLLK